MVRSVSRQQLTEDLPGVQGICWAFGRTAVLAPYSSGALAT